MEFFAILVFSRGDSLPPVSGGELMNSRKRAQRNAKKRNARARRFHWGNFAIPQRSSVSSVLFVIDQPFALLFPFSDCSE